MIFSLCALEPIDDQVLFASSSQRQEAVSETRGSGRAQWLLRSK